MEERLDPYRVNATEHRGRDKGILSILFHLPKNRKDDNDIRGPKPLKKCE